MNRALLGGPGLYRWVPEFAACPLGWSRELEWQSNPPRAWSGRRPGRKRSGSGSRVGSAVLGAKRRAPSGGGEGGPPCPPGTRGGLEASEGAPQCPELPQERWHSPGVPGLELGAPGRTVSVPDATPGRAGYNLRSRADY
ncbi:hypothetical protein NDU88_003709 [Pleurodeles waltl]|uniref:Uncharacterized protein n=1 Tax=Pleurodeles waltl TaxID=8319 RepID=A0AAV7WSE7_PLEWA|nr:hypothetical protein NDU88_003709 [Pleurodeles waltl]